MTDDQIIEIAEQMFDTTTDARGRKAYDGDNHQVLAFARLIEKQVKEEDACIAEETAAGRDAEAIAEAIRSQP